MVWPIILEMNSFRDASYYGRGIGESTNGYSIAVGRTQSSIMK
jgi:hypothetical protein